MYPESKQRRINYIFNPLIKVLKKQIGIKKLSKSNLLDIGSGSGIFANILFEEKIVKKIICVEPSKILVKNYSNKIEVLNKMLNETKIKKNSIDVITAFNVIEHTFDPNEFIKRCSYLLLNKGYIFITTPNTKGLEIMVNGKNSNSFENERLNYFNITSIKKILENNNLIIKKVSSIGKLDLEILANQNKKIINNKWIEYILKNCSKLTLNKFQKFLTNNLLSSHLLIIAQKNHDN